MTDEAPGIICTIKKYRRRKKLSQTELAQLVGVRRQAIYDMESCRYLPNTAVALKLAQVLGCSIEMLFMEEGSPPTSAVHLLEDSSPSPIFPFPSTLSRKGALGSNAGADIGAGAGIASGIAHQNNGCQPNNAQQPLREQGAQAPAKPTRLSLAQVRDKLIGIPLQAPQNIAFPLQVADGTLLPDNTLESTLSAAQLAKTLLVLGCDPALSLLQELITRAAPVFRTHTVFASSRKALVALNEGNTHIAATHFHSSNSADANIEAIRSLAGRTKPLVIAFAVQEEGFMVAPGNPLRIRDVDDLTNPAVRFVNREEGAALRKLLENRLVERGIPLSTVRDFNKLTYSHNDGATLILTNQTDVVLGLRIIAEAHGLDFVPLAVTRSDLVIPADLQNHQGVGILLNILQSSALQKELRNTPGYDSSITGKIISRE